MSPPQAFYYDGKPIMSDEEFENLEQELLWSGSRVAVLRCAVRQLADPCYQLPAPAAERDPSSSQLR